MRSAAGMLLGLLVTVSAMAREWPTKAPPEAERGKELYIRHCAACHGTRGAGDGPAAAALVQKVPDFTEGFGKRAQDELVKVVLYGKGVMPGFETAFPKEDADRVVKFMAKLGRSGEEAKPEPPEEASQEDDGADGDVGG